MPLTTSFDFRNPEYLPVFKDRIDFINRIRAEPQNLPALKLFYRDHPADFISDFGMTYDPRQAEHGQSSTVPFILFDRQREWVDWILARWRGRQDGITEKSRDMGISWLAVCLSATLCIFNPGVTIGFGSKTEDDVDKSGDPGTLFWKARFFVNNLPREFRGGFDAKTTTSHMLLRFPESGSTMKGDAGDNIGRGDRASLYFVDEASHLARPQLVDAALSQTTNCRQDVSTPRGLGNSFAQRRHSGKLPVFTFHWRNDPRKDEEWYAIQKDRLAPVILAQEVDLDYSASVEGVLIPSAWVQAAIGAHAKLNITPTGARTGALDVADEGKDKNAFCVAHGVVVQALEEWSGKGDDIFGTVQKAFALSDEHRLTGFKYDADGLGAGVRGDARVINEARKAEDIRQLSVTAFRGSASVFNPEGEDVKGRKNQDFFMNAKAQAWWSLRARFQRTYRAVVEGAEVKPDDIISLDPSLPCLSRLCGELSQPTYSVNAVGKIVVDKSPEGMRSPNLADAVMMQFAKVARGPMLITPDALAAI